MILNIFINYQISVEKFCLYLCVDISVVDSLSVRDVLSSLINFMESASLGDFCYRLHLLKAFTVHIGVVSLSQDSTSAN